MRKRNYFNPTELETFENSNPIFDSGQMKIINRKTPESEIEIKTDKNGFKYKSVKAAYIKALVTLVTGGNYNFEIKSRELITSTREVLTEGRLTLFVNGKKITREQFGQHHLNIHARAEGQTTITFPVDIGNGYKASASDCFKKCASEFGFCWDIYGQDHAEKKETDQAVPDHSEMKKLERLEHFLKQSATIEEVEFHYERYLETAKETKESKDILKKFIKDNF